MSETDKPAARGSRMPVLALLGLALLLPALSLIPFGSLWLWERGLIIPWAMATFAIVSVAFVLLRRLLLPMRDAVESERPADLSRAVWNRRQEDAWADVQAFSRSVDPARLASRDDMMALGLETVRRVARHMHPEHDDPLLRFTLPEAFAVIEQASAGMRGFVESNLPFGDRITVAQIMWVYRWRTIVPLVEKGYDIWRIVRLFNPISAATQELRERYTRQIYEMGRAHIAQRLAQAFVKEVGKAAIDLYGGSLRVRQEQLARHTSDASLRDAATLDRVAAEPIRILVAGEDGSGKSSLINRLLGAAEAAVDVIPSTHQQLAYRLSRDGLPEALLIDTPGLEGEWADKGLSRAMADCDLLIWVTAATRAARARERAVLDALRANEAANARGKVSTLVVMTHIDMLRPFALWEPPYDVQQPASAKAQSIRGALDAVVRELGVAAGSVLPVRSDKGETEYNIDAVWASIAEALPDAKRSRLQRCLKGAGEAWTWGGVLAQAANAGRIVSRGLFRP